MTREAADNVDKALSGSHWAAKDPNSGESKD